MRVIAGRWRGRGLVTLPGEAVRPTTGRVREALFSMLGEAVAGARVADLCCGAGSLGIEALSRGAAHCTFVDVAAASLRVTRANLAALGAEPRAWRLLRADAQAWLSRQEGAPAPLLVLADPPYGAPVAAALVALLLARPPGRLVTRAVVEHATDDPGVPAAAPPDSPWRLRRRRYGRTTLTLLEA